MLDQWFSLDRGRTNRQASMNNYDFPQDLEEILRAKHT